MASTNNNETSIMTTTTTTPPPSSTTTTTVAAAQTFEILSAPPPPPPTLLNNTNQRQMSNVKFVLFQPFVGDNEVDKMSLHTLLEAAKFLELQEQNQTGGGIVAGATVSAPLSSTSTTTLPIGTVSLLNENNAHILQNGSSGGGGGGGGGTTTQTFTLQPVKVLNASSIQPITVQSNNYSTSIQSQALPPPPPPPSSTVVITNNSFTPAFLQGTVSLCSSSSAQHQNNNGIITDEKTNLQLAQQRNTSTTRIYNNSFDIMNPLIIDESNPGEQKKIKQPPMPFRNGNRDVHNKLEKHRRAHLKECFELLKKQLPSNGKEKKTSNLSILHSAYKYIESLKRKEAELEQDMERLAKEKINHQQRLNALKKDISSMFDNVDFAKIFALDNATAAATTTTNNGNIDLFNNDLTTLIPFNNHNINDTITNVNSTVTAISSSSTSSSSSTVQQLAAVFDATNKIYIKTTALPDSVASSPPSSLSAINNQITTAVVSATSIPTFSITEVIGGGGSGVTAVDCLSTSSLVNSNAVINSSSAAAILTSGAAAAAGTTTNVENKISIPILSAKNLPIVTTTQATAVTNIKEITQPVQQTGISVVPMTTYPVNQGLVLQKVAIVPHKGLTELTPLVSTFYTAPQQLNGLNGQLNGKVVPLTQYLVKPVVVVSTANPRTPGS